MLVACFPALKSALVHGVVCLHSINGVDLGAKTLDEVFKMLNGPVDRSGLLRGWFCLVSRRIGTEPARNFGVTAGNDS